MPDVSLDPPIPRPAPAEFSQAVRVVQAAAELGRARWHVTGDGVVQIVEIYVHPPHRRSGIAKQLTAAVLEQARLYHTARRRRLRRVWLLVAQKTHVAARAFLTHHAFHHVATHSDLFRDEDALLYVRAFD